MYIISTFLSSSTLFCALSRQGDLKPDDAANMLTIYEGKFTRLKEDRDNLFKAKEESSCECRQREVRPHPADKGDFERAGTAH